MTGWALSTLASMELLNDCRTRNGVTVFLARGELKACDACVMSGLVDLCCEDPKDAPPVMHGRFGCAGLVFHSFQVMKRKDTPVAG
jgi:hypothetical protein